MDWPAWLTRRTSARGAESAARRKVSVRWRIGMQGAPGEAEASADSRAWFESSRELESGLAVTDFGEYDDAHSKWADTESPSQDWPDTISLLPPDGNDAGGKAP